MKKISAFLIAISLLLFLFAPFTIKSVLPSNIDPGDTFIYNITEWNVPWAEISSPTDPGFDINDLVLDLSESTLGVKVMTTFDDGSYLLDFYVILGKTIEFPLPDNATEEMKNIYGESIKFEKGIGLGLGSIPGSDLMELIENTSEDPAIGIPFYVNPSEWNTYELVLEKTLENITHTITNEVGQDFSININGETEDDISISLTAKWFREGDNAGVFKSIEGNAIGDVDDDDSEEKLEIKLEFSNKQYNPLPSIIRNKGNLNLKLETVDVGYSGSGFFQNEDMTALLDTIEYLIEGLDQKTILTYNITDIIGCYYNSSISYYDLLGELNVSIPEMQEIPEAMPILWDGFTGAPVFLGQMLNINPYEEIVEERVSVIPLSVGLVPLMAPGITPDWDMWKASSKTVADFLQLTEAGIKEATNQDDFKNGGGNLNSLEILYEMRESGNVKFFYSECKFDLEWAAANMESYLEPFTATSKLELKGTLINWLAYSNEGTLLGIGLETDITLSVTDFPYEAVIYLLNSLSTEMDIQLPIDIPEESINGDLNIKINLQAETGQISEIPNPEDATKIAGTEPKDNEGITPGFETISVLIIMAAMGIFFRKRK